MSRHQDIKQDITLEYFRNQVLPHYNDLTNEELEIRIIEICEDFLEDGVAAAPQIGFMEDPDCSPEYPLCGFVQFWCHGVQEAPYRRIYGEMQSPPAKDQREARKALLAMAERLGGSGDDDCPFEPFANGGLGCRERYSDADVVARVAVRDQGKLKRSVSLPSFNEDDTPWKPLPLAY